MGGVIRLLRGPLGSIMVRYVLQEYKERKIDIKLLGITTRPWGDITHNYCQVSNGFIVWFRQFTNTGEREGRSPVALRQGPSRYLKQLNAIYWGGLVRCSILHTYLIVLIPIPISTTTNSINAYVSPKNID